MLGLKPRAAEGMHRSGERLKNSWCLNTPWNWHRGSPVQCTEKGVMLNQEIVLNLTRGVLFYRQAVDQVKAAIAAGSGLATGYRSSDSHKSLNITEHSP